MSEINDYPLELQPLKQSHEHDCLETELKALFIALFEDTLRAKERDLNVYGMPHLGSFELVSRFVKEDGLALVNNDDEAAMRYLHKAWSGRNPRRGLHFIKTYLQLLWPNRSKAYQTWHRKDQIEAYPAAEMPRAPFFTGDPEDDHFLSCRVVALVQFDNDPSSRAVIEPALRSSLAAEFLLELRAQLVTGTAITQHAACAFGSLINIDSTLVDPLSAGQSITSAAAATFGLLVSEPAQVVDPLSAKTTQYNYSGVSTQGSLIRFDCQVKNVIPTDLQKQWDVGSASTAHITTITELKIDL